MSAVKVNDDFRDTLWINGRGRLLAVPLVLNENSNAAQERSLGELGGAAGQPMRSPSVPAAFP
jgi:hypothetical protein